MEELVCCGRNADGKWHSQPPDNWVPVPDAGNKKPGAPKPSPSPGAVGIIDGEREPLPE